MPAPMSYVLVDEHVCSEYAQVVNRHRASLSVCSKKLKDQTNIGLRPFGRLTVGL